MDDTRELAWEATRNGFPNPSIALDVRRSRGECGFRCRSQFCTLLGINGATLDNRTRAGQLPLAFGLRMPAAAGEYRLHDVFVNLLCDALCGRGFARADAADILREGHEVWLDGLTRSEWEPSWVTRSGCAGVIAERMIYLGIARDGKGRFAWPPGCPRKRWRG